MSLLVEQSCELSLVIPAFNEGSHLAHSLRIILRHLEAVTADFEILVVDDGSTDKTWTELEKLHVSEPRISGVRLSRNFGKEYAITAGLERANGRAVMILDADLQHPPIHIERFYEVWKSGKAEIVDGVKRRRDEPLWRRWFSYLFGPLATWLTGVELRDSSDYKLLDRKVIDAWKRLPERRCFFRGMISWVGFRHVSLEFDVLPRRHGASRWSLLDLVRLAGRAVISHSAVPLRLLHLGAASFFLFALWLGSQALYLKLSGQAVDGVTTVIILILLLGSLLLLGLGILGEYLAAIYEEIKARPRFVVADELRAPGTLDDQTSQIRSLAEQVGLLAGAQTPKLARNPKETLR